MDSELVLIINALLYTSTLVFFIIKYKFSVGVVVWALYTVSAWGTYLFVQNPYYFSGIHNSQQRLVPCIYMYAVNLIAMFPLVKFKEISQITFVHEKVAVAIMVICTIQQILFIVIDIPTITHVLTSPDSALVNIRDAGYSESVSLVENNAVLNRFYLLFSGMRIIASGLSVYFLFEYKEKRLLVWMFFISTLLNNLRLIIVSVGRGEMLLLFLFYFCVFYSLRNRIKKKIIAVILVAMVPIFIVGMTFFWTITVSRFGKYAEYSLYKYLGEPMNNFNGLLFYKIKGHTYGRAYFSLFYRYLLGEEDFINTTDKWSMIYKYTGINGNIFYTWIGGLVIEFGKVAPIVFAVAINRLMNHLYSLKEYYIGDLFVIIFFLNFFLRGIFIFPTQNFDGTFMIIYTILFYFLFRTRKNKAGNIVYVVPKNIKSSKKKKRRIIV